MDRGAWLATVNGVTKLDTTEATKHTALLKEDHGYEGQYLREGRPRTKQNKKQGEKKERDGGAVGEGWGLQGEGGKKEERKFSFSESWKLEDRFSFN